MSELPCDCCDGCTDRVYLACEYCESVIEATKRLSPAVRELLLTNPEAVEKCVEAVKARRDWQKYALTDSEDEFYIKAENAMNRAIALLPKEPPK